MDGSTPCANMVSEDIGCETSVYSLSCEKPHVEHKEGTYCNTKETANITPQAALGVLFVSEENLGVGEAGTVPGAFLHAANLDGRLSDPNAISDQEDTQESKEIETCQESCGSVSSDANKLKSLNRCATFPCSSEAQLDTLPIKGSNEESSTEVQDRCSSTFKSPAYPRSLSLPTSLKPVSAMKGSRAQNGTTPPTMKLHVKWAPDVYDPPATSMSHTVKKSHHQRPKAKKRDSHKSKHNKGKYSRGSGMERKHANHSILGSVSDPSDLRLPVAGDRLLLDRYVESNVEVLEYAVTTRESKCGGGGGGFLREALAKVNLSTAEAS